MAEVRLGRAEAEDGRLPRVCIVCGEPADEYKRRQFSWYPPWVNALIVISPIIAAIVALILTKRLRARVPLCAAHTYHWVWRLAVVLTSLAVLIALGVASAFLVAELDRRRPDAGGIVCIGMMVVGVLWLIAVIVIQVTAVRPTEITDRDMRLTHVSEEFVDALRDVRRGRRDDADDFDDRPRRRRRPRYEDEDEDEYYER